jgi:hypothetical protein
MWEQNDDRIEICRHFNICNILAQIPFDNDTELCDTVQVYLGLRSSEVLSTGNLK